MKEKLKIVMLGHKRVPSREGGIEVVVEELSTRMVALGHQVTLFNRKGHHVAGKKFDTMTLKEYKGVELIGVPTINRKGFAAFTSSIGMAFKAAFGDYDIVHFHAEGPSFMCWLPKLMKKRIIVTVHGIDYQRAKWGLIARLYIMLGERNAVKYADEIIVLSSNMQQYFLTKYNRKTVFIPNGIDKKEIEEADLIQKQYGLTKDSYILFLGRIVPEKGLDYLIEAYSRLDTDKKLVIAGGASDTDRFNKSIRKKGAKDSRILFTDFVQGKLKHELYSNAYLYILPSDLEGMPISLLEAMAYGNCCLTSDIPECVEVTRDYALYFQKGNVDDLASKLAFLLAHHEIVEQYRLLAADYIMNHYHWDDTVDLTLALYQGEAYENTHD